MSQKGLRFSVLAVALAAAAMVAPASAQEKAPPGGNYQKVSGLVALPDFLPGLGTLYVDPKTLPAGPFLAYDKDGKLVSTVYMIPLKDLDAHKGFNNLTAATSSTTYRFMRLSHCRRSCLSAWS